MIYFTYFVIINKICLKNPHFLLNNLVFINDKIIKKTSDFTNCTWGSITETTGSELPDGCFDKIRSSKKVYE